MKRSTLHDTFFINWTTYDKLLECPWHVGEVIDATACVVAKTLWPHGVEVACFLDMLPVGGTTILSCRLTSIASAHSWYWWQAFNSSTSFWIRSHFSSAKDFVFFAGRISMSSLLSAVSSSSSRFSLSLQAPRRLFRAALWSAASHYSMLFSLHSSVSTRLHSSSSVQI